MRRSIRRPLSLLVISLSLAAGGGARGEDQPANPAPPAEKKPPAPFVFYGRVNVSLDEGSQGLAGQVCHNPNLCTATSFTGAGSTGAVGNLRWIPDLASNLSRFGVRGGHELTEGYSAVFQLEAEVAVTATPGVKANGNNDTINPGNNAINGALASRNSFVGFTTPYGALKAGKSDTPYKISTADFDFLGETAGDYNSIMGNTGGDNRTEFDARFPHALWYESPNLSGFRVNAMWSPGQNRFADDQGFAIAETVCAGGNSGPCNDGSWGTAYSVSGSYEGFGLKAIVAYEMHYRVNRTGDAGATVANGTVSQVGVANETGFKVGAKYTIGASGTTVAGIFEDMLRGDNASYNERQRTGFYFSALQKLGKNLELMAGWAHANATPGDPTRGPVNAAGCNAALGACFDNAANMVTGGLRHWFDTKTAVYLVYAALVNGEGAHYALGPGGHGVTWDCKDGSGPAAAGVAPGVGLVGNGTQCFTGTTIQAFSLGMIYDF